MDNNPFRSQQQPLAGNSYLSNGQPQQQPQQQQQQPYQVMGYYQQQPQQPLQPQQPQQQWNYQQPGLDNNNSMYTSPPTFNNAYLNNNSFPQQTNNPSFSSTPYSPYSNTLPTNQGYNQGMPYTNNMGYQQQSDPSNFYIPPNFGVSNTNTYQPQQPRHAPVDATSLLKGTEIRRVECPVCKKMLEGDDMAINHHVNDHLN